MTLDSLNNALTVISELTNTLHMQLTALENTDTTPPKLLNPAYIAAAKDIQSLKGEVDAAITMIRRLVSAPAPTQLSEDSMYILLHIAEEACYDDMTLLANKAQRDAAVRAAEEIAAIRRERAKLAAEAGRDTEAFELELLADGADCCADAFAEWMLVEDEDEADPDQFDAVQ